jgi:acetoacetyl-CoA synthetase
MLAATSIGAVWSSCSPDFGVQGVLDRFGQIEPKVLFAPTATTTAARPSTPAALAEIAAQLPTRRARGGRALHAAADLAPGPAR